MIKKFTRYIFIFFIFFFCIFAIFQLQNNQPYNVLKQLDLKNKLYCSKDFLVFKISFFGIFPSGKAEIENKGFEKYKDKTVIRLSVRAYPLSLIAKFFKAEVEAASYIEPNKLHTLKFTRRIIIPDLPTEAKEVLYDQEDNTMILDGVKREILPDTQDPLSAIFYLQRQPFFLNKEFDININTNQKNYRLYAKVIKKENYVLRDKRLDVWVLDGEIKRRDKSPRHAIKIRVWFLDGDIKLPFLIKVMTSVGPITSRLEDCK